MKVLTIVGTRPELIKLSLTIKELDKHTDHILAHTGQNFDYELNDVFFNELQIRKPDYFLNCSKESSMEAIASVLVETDKLVKKIKPDACLLYGDTNSCLAAIALKKNQIPIFHMEAGNRSFDQRVPEEVNRKIVDHLSDINMTLTEHSRKYLIAEGLSAQKVIKTGSSMPEIFSVFAGDIDGSTILNDLQLKQQNYFLVSSHRAENVDSIDNIHDLFDSLNALAEKYQKPIIFSVHPRTKNKIDSSDIQPHNLIQFSKPFGFFDYIHLQKNALCVLSDSGTITEESSLLKFKAITMRPIHERPEGTDVGALIMCSLKKESLLKAVEATLKMEHTPLDIKDYSMTAVSKVVVKTILSYTEFINRTTYYKSA